MLRLKIAVIHNNIDSETLSGESIVAMDTVRMIEESGNVALLITPADLKLNCNIIFYFLRLFFPLFSFIRLSKFIKREKINIVHIHGYIPQWGITPFLLGISKNIKVVLTLHNVRWLCIEGGMSRNGEFCNLCANNSGLTGLRYRCVAGSPSKSFVSYIFNLAFFHS